MTTRFFLKMLCLCLALSLAVPAASVRPECPPKLGPPEGNDMQKKFNGLVEAYAQAIKDKDEAKKKELDGQAKELEGMSGTVEAKIKPEEAEAFGKYMAAQTQKLLDAEQEAAK